MALLTCTYYSESLLGMTKIHVYIPTPGGKEWAFGTAKDHPFFAGKKFPVLYLLHGMGEDASTILRKTRIESYAKDAQIAVVMPEGENSFYTDPAYGRRYESYIAKELPLFIQDSFPVSDKREETYIGGFSMGGFGALRLGLKYAETFAKILAFSGPYDVTEFPLHVFEGEEGTRAMHWEALAGEDFSAIPGSDLDPYVHANALAYSERVRPEIFLSCGTEDPLYPAHVKTQEVLSSLGIAYIAQEAAGGHDYDYWDPALLSAVSWLTEVQ